MKIYKSKKRIELRLFAKKIQEANLLISWDFKNLYPSFVSLKEIITQNKLKEHLKNEVEKFFA